jgi:hypothetical protein
MERNDSPQSQGLLKGCDGLQGVADCRPQKGVGNPENAKARQSTNRTLST